SSSARAATRGPGSSDCTSTSTPPTATRTPSWSGCSLSAPGPPTSARPAPRAGTSWPTQKATNSASCTPGSSPYDHVHPGAKSLGRSSEAGGFLIGSAAKLAHEFRLVHRRAAADGAAAAGLRVELVVGGAVGTGV